MARKVTAVCVVLFALSGLAAAKTIYVPNEDCASIQCAIDDPCTVAGDEIVVGYEWADPQVPQVYSVNERDIDFKGKAITVRSRYGAAYCIIDCQGTQSDPHQGFRFHNGESHDLASGDGSVVQGFTIKNGYGYYGGAIECVNSSPIIRDCIITQNTAQYYGGGIECYGSSPLIVNCLFYDNEAMFGGAIDCEDASPSIYSCTFDNNDAIDGGGIFLSFDSQPEIYSSIFTHNSNHAIHEYAPTPESNVTVMFSCLFFANPNGDFHDADTAMTYTGSAAINGLDSGYGNNYDEDPLFVQGPLSHDLGSQLGGFYLSQISAGQLKNSPAWNKGYSNYTIRYPDDAVPGYTSRTDNVTQYDGTPIDDEDIGFHYQNNAPTNTYQLAVEVIGGNGVVDPYLPSPGMVYKEFSQVPLTATPDEGYAVSSWAGTTQNWDGGTLNSGEAAGPGWYDVPPQEMLTLYPLGITESWIEITGDMTVAVGFEPREIYQLTTSVNGDGGQVLNVTPPAIDPDLYYKYEYAELQATPEAGHVVKGWNGLEFASDRIIDMYVSYGEVHILMDQNRAIEVEFIRDHAELMVHFDPMMGTVHPRSGRYPLGEQVELWAYPNAGYKFAGWSGVDEVGDPTDQNAIVVMNQNKTVYANFIPIPEYDIDFNILLAQDGQPHGDVHVLSPAPSVNGKYFEGSEIILQATPDAGYVVQWLSNFAMSIPPDQASFTITEDTTITARFFQSELPGGSGICVYSPGPDGEPDWAAGPKACFDTIQDAIDDPNTLSGIYGPYVVEEDPEATPVPIVGLPETPGDIVVVTDGVYTGDGNRDINFNGKLLTVRSEFGPANCIIECDGSADEPHQGFIFQFEENSAAVVDGFTIRGGYAESGGAISITGISRPLITNCIIENNYAEVGGGGVYFEGLAEDDTTYEDLVAEYEALATELEDALGAEDPGAGDPCDPCSPGSEGPDPEEVFAAMVARAVAIVAQQVLDSIDAEDADRPTLTNCVIRSNNVAFNATGNGGGIFCTNSSPRIISTEISNNQVGQSDMGQGGGVYCEAGSLAEFINCLVVKNSATDGGGGFQLVGASDAIIQLCTVVDNKGGNTLNTTDDGIVCDEESAPTISHCIVYHPLGNDLVNCEADEFCLVGQVPRFVTGPSLNYSPGYYLSHAQTEGFNSPAVDTGDADFLGTLQVPLGEEGGYGLPVQLTTSIVNLTDVEPTDLGFHYPFGSQVIYDLHITVIGDGVLNFAGQTVTPGNSPYLSHWTPGTRVSMTAVPDCGYRVDYWSGTDADTLFTKINQVTMYTRNRTIHQSTRHVFLVFEEANKSTINVPGDFPYIGLQDALDRAKEGDTVVIHSSGSPYRGTGFTLNKNITITSADPHNPNVVTNTVIDCAGERWGFDLFGDPLDLYGTAANCSGGGSGDSDFSGPGYDYTVLAGVTVMNANTGYVTGLDGLIAGWSGQSGGSKFGVGIRIFGNHHVVNCEVRNCTVRGNDGGNGLDGGDDTLAGELPAGGHGGNGSNVAGAGIYVGSGSPLVKNCLIDGCVVIGGDGGDGAVGLGGEAGPPAMPAYTGGQGGIGGRAYGAGIYYDVGTNPTIEDCTVSNCIAYGGNGGNGGAGGDCPIEVSGTGPGGDGGVPGSAQGAGIYCGAGSSSAFTGLTVTNCQAIGGQGGNGADGGTDFGGLGGFGGGTSYDPFQQKPWQLSANGGGVYCGWASAVVFTDCRFENNSTTGSISGIGGFANPNNYHSQPRTNYNIPSFGGGVYCAIDSNATFTNCEIQNNDTAFVGGNFTGYGGGLCFGGSKEIEYPSNPVPSMATLNDCRITGNSSSAGGGVYVTSTDYEVGDCTITDNGAFLGGGLYSTNSIAEILQTQISRNNASSAVSTEEIDPNQTGGTGTEMFGSGGGLYCFTTDAAVKDCTITQNNATGSGGGVYIGGHPGTIHPFEATPELSNCLIAENTAILDGAGVSCNWYAESAITNCTIANNRLIGSDTYGGGLYASYESQTEVIDSIIWGNLGVYGSEVAVGSGDLYYPLPSVLDISYSDVKLAETAGESNPYLPGEWDAVDADTSPVIRPGFDSSALAANDDSSTSLVDIGFMVNYFGIVTQQLYVNNNGNVTFNQPLWEFTPFGLTSNIGTPIIAPFFADVDTRAENSPLVTYGQGTVDGHVAFGVNWVGLGYYSQNMDKINDFQLILIDRSDRMLGSFDIEFNYEQVQWETGDASLGTGGLGGQSVRVGFSAGTGTDGTFFEFEGSGANGAFLDTNTATGLIYASRNSSLNGRYIFSVEAGMLDQLAGLYAPESFIYVENGCTLNDQVIYDFDPETFGWEPTAHNISENPLFIADYFLSQIDAGQLKDSPCVNIGSRSALAAGLDEYTTRTDGQPDGAGSSVNGQPASQVDMGYHRPEFESEMAQYQLTTILTSEIGGVITPDHPEGSDYSQYAQVELTVTTPPVGYRVVWTGTDDDNRTEPNNIVTMDADKTVTAAYEWHYTQLTVQAIGGQGAITIDPAGFDGYYPPGTVVGLTAVAPGEGYRIKGWTGTDDDSSWAFENTVTMTSDRDVTVEFELDASKDRLVPHPYPTIDAAITAARDGDKIVLAFNPDNPYLVSGTNGIDPMGKAITIMSEDPDEEEIIAGTIIDCQGTGLSPKRAFHFHSGEGSDTLIKGITIKNGFMAGAVGASASLPGYLIDPEADPTDPEAVRSANLGASATGDGYGGAILFENGSSPIFENCIITNCSVTGGQGGDGGNGYYVSDGMDPPDGQWGGHGGNGSGRGYGGAIACLTESSPKFINCTFDNNTAQGGQGGRGGNGSQKATPEDGAESNGGNGGNAIGEGFGGAIYCDSTSRPIITKCTFSGNKATSAIGGNGGQPGPGSVLDPPATVGSPGWITTNDTSSGGVAYFVTGSDPNFVDCTFTANSAYSVYKYYGGYSYGLGSTTTDEPLYTRGGVLYVEADTNVRFEDCTFTDNFAGVLYCETNNNVDIDDCTFVNNKTRLRIDPLSQSYNYYGLYGYYGYYFGYSNYYSYWGYYSPFGVPTVPAGAVFVGPGGEAEMRNCDFAGNYSHGDGGAINLRGHADLYNCSFSNNEAVGSGGAIEAYDPGTNALVQIGLQACIFTDNKAQLGGAMYGEDFDATITNTYIAGNSAQSGGALFLVDGYIKLDTGIMNTNHATGKTGVEGAVGEAAGLGGAVACMATNATIENYIIAGNVADGVYSYGGAINFYGGDGLSHIVKNCLFTGNDATLGGGAVSASIYSSPEIQNCTFSGNSAGSFGGGIFSDWSSDPQVVNSIFANCSNQAVYEEQIGGDASVEYSLFYNNPDGDYYDSDAGRVYTGAANINLLAGNMNNIDGSPMFVGGPLGNFYLMQTSSAAVDAGSGFAADLGFDIYTTDATNNLDAGMVDLGYHYRDITILQQYELTITVPSGHGTVMIQPMSGTYYDGAVVTLTAIPDEGYRVASWSGGTTDDSSTENTATVIMNSDKQIEVTFEQPRVLIVGTEPHYTSIQAAIDDAVNGDTVIIQTGMYTPSVWGNSISRGISFYGKDIILKGTNPDDPDVVAATVLRDYDFYLYDLGPKSKIAGITITGGGRLRLYNCLLTIQNCNITNSHWYGGDPSDTPDGCAQDGLNGGSLYGGAISMYNSSPKILNCTFQNLSITGGVGGLGNDGCEEHPSGGDGGWPGRAYGGAVYCAFSSNPIFVDCLFADCYVQGGVGGNGGNGTDTGHGGRGGGWEWPPSVENDPSWWYWWDGWTYGDKYSSWSSWGRNNYDWKTWSQWFEADQWDSWQDWYTDYLANSSSTLYLGNSSSTLYLQMTPYDAYEDYWEYSGYGGAVYCEYDSSPKFDGCVFDNNRSYSSLSGIGGTGGTNIIWPLPDRNLVIENAGGAVYAANGSNPEFTDCLFTDNLADPSLNPPLHPGVEPGEAPGGDEGETPALSYNDDYYVSFGGAVAHEDGCEPKFVSCEFIGNEATMGGGLYMADSVIQVADCNFIGNTAYHGAGIHTTSTRGTIADSYLSENLAVFNSANVFDPCDPCNVPEITPVLGQGGGYYCLSSVVDIIDSVFTNNNARSSGGGVYFTGSDEDIEFVPRMKNCLLVNNTAGRDGGAISINWYAEPEISNCTITNNVATGGVGPMGLGGGISASYNSATTVTDSIIWNNVGAGGAQIAIGSGDPYGPNPSAFDITYSDIGPPFGSEVQGSDSQSSAGGSQQATIGPFMVESQTIYNQLDLGQGMAEVIVSLKEPAIRQTTDWSDSASVSELRSGIAALQSSVIGSLAGEFILKHQYENQAGFSGQITTAGLNTLLNNSSVYAIEPVRYFRRMLAQAIPLGNADEVRNVFDGSGIAIAIVDSGIDYTHPMLGDAPLATNTKVIGGYDTADEDNDPMPVNDAHGTCCAGIAAGSLGMTGDYIGGVAPGAKLYALKAAPDGSPLFATDDIVQAWNWCISHQGDDPDNPIMVISNSLGSSYPYNDSAQADQDYPSAAMAAATAVSNGITILASSGNDGHAGAGISGLSALSNVISVGAVYDTTDMVTDYSNTADILDILAPADPVYTTDIVGADGYDPGDYFPSFNGTSSACPFAAGAVADLQSAALIERGNYLTPSEVRDLLVSTGDAVKDTKVNITKPRVNLGAAVSNLSYGPPVYVEDGCTLNGEVIENFDPATFTWSPDDNNIEENPMFVNGYYLSQTIAGQSVDSPCVDAGSSSAIDVGLDTYTTRTDAAPDMGIVDMGYHYSMLAEGSGSLELCSFSDLDRDGVVNLVDFSLLAEFWLTDYCSNEQWCSGFTQGDYWVDDEELLLFAQCWLRWDNLAPVPDPSMWSMPPYSGSDTSITMIATTAHDNWGWGVEYYFEETTGHSGGSDSGWQDGSTYTDQGLNFDTEYTYRVRTRDLSPFKNLTAWSDERSAVAGEDIQAPGPVQWQQTPNATGKNSISMEAKVATDPEGSTPVEYFFEELSGNGGGSDSGWQPSTTYADNGLLAGTPYRYRFKVRDSAGNESSWSTEQQATTEAEPTGNPPYPVGGNVGDAAQWAVAPYVFYRDGYAYHGMTAAPAVDPDGDTVLYYFECTSDSDYSSTWQDPTGILGPEGARSWDVRVGVGANYCYTVRYGDNDGTGQPKSESPPSNEACSGG
ncbi:MAG: InlB B-repeat-containing protein [Planctomycetota bacterium]|jgi:hypothetical protein